MSNLADIESLPRFEGSHCPSQSNHEYVKRVDTGSYVRLEDVIKILIAGRLKMSNKGIGVGDCAKHGEYFLDAYDSPCPSCEDEENEDE